MGDEMSPLILFQKTKSSVCLLGGEVGLCVWVGRCVHACTHKPCKSKLFLRPALSSVRSSQLTFLLDLSSFPHLRFFSFFLSFLNVIYHLLKSDGRRRQERRPDQPVGPGRVELEGFEIRWMCLGLIVAFY